MIGSLMSMGGYLLVLFVLSIWAVVKVWRSSPLLAILCFFFWPASLIALIKYWGDEDSDIRVPFFLSLVVSLLLGYMATRAVNQGIDEMAYYLTDEDIAEVRRSDPAMADRLQAARDAAIAEDGDPYQYDDEDGDWEDVPERPAARRPVPSTPAPAAAPAAPAEVDPVLAEARARAELAQAVQLLSWKFGSLDLSPAPASLSLPATFRFLPRINALRIGQLRGTPLGSDVLGWAVHREVDLGRDDAWYVELRYQPTPAGRLPAPPSDPAATDAAQQNVHYASRLAAALADGRREALAPAWDAESGIATWSWPSEGMEGHHDHVAARPLGAGVLTYRVAGLHESHAELGRRSIRLAAASTRVRDQ
ncbi:MAG: hypothetical protein WCZ65_06780 [Lysobacteraceae bacterium]